MAYIRKNDLHIRPPKGSVSPSMPLDIDLQMARLEVKLLREQFSSHFLFNHFNAINYCILRGEPKVASSYLTQFARLLRRITADSRREFVRLSEEIETIRLFIRIESMRFGKPIHFVTCIQAGLDPVYVWVPTLILHTYVENAIWHIMQQHNEEGMIRLELIKKKTRYHLLLKDNGQGEAKPRPEWLRPQDESELEMTHERLRLINRQFGTDLKVTLTNSEPSGEPTGSRTHPPRPAVG